jgi:hypothetical protein
MSGDRRLLADDVSIEKAWHEIQPGAGAGADHARANGAWIGGSTIKKRPPPEGAAVVGAGKSLDITPRRTLRHRLADSG